MLLQLANWVKNDANPPESAYPKLAEKNLVDIERLTFPSIPGIEKPTVMHNAYRADYGPRWKNGIIDQQPPKLGYSFPQKIAQVDSLGNELGGIRNVEIIVPLATYTPWNLRSDATANKQELTDFRGTFIPLPRTEAERQYKNDPRPSIEQLYPDKKSYISKVKKVAQKLNQQGFLLEEDIAYVQERASQSWDWIHSFDRYAGLTKGPKNGHLIIIGGGRLDSLFYGKFMELAGGEDAPIVVIPTAGITDPEQADAACKRQKLVFENRGFKKVTVLHTTDSKEADTKELAQALETAKGVWFTGGRQWRLVDSYADTRSEELFHKVLERGGVIAGSSAGATIQGSYLARGDTRTNMIMMGDHEEGFGFVSNISIDQHVLARNRQFDQFEIMEALPHLLGIGLDENTGILVNGNTFEVIGKSYIMVYDHHLRVPYQMKLHAQKPGERKFYLMRPGEKYDMAKRALLPVERR